MLNLKHISPYFPKEIAENPVFSKYLLKEQIQLMILDFLSTSAYVKNIVFIGGTNLRLVKGIDRFSEDLDFDCKEFSENEFMAMTDIIVQFLQRSGMRVETRDKANDKLTAFRRNIYFPELLFDMKLSGYKDERFMVKIEAQDQGVNYVPIMVNIKRMGFFFPFPVPPDATLCAMKVSALLARQKGRDFYDAMFLLGQTEPDYAFLSEKCSIHNIIELKESLIQTFDNVNIKLKSQDFTHLLFNRNNSEKILRFAEFVRSL